MRSSVRRGGFYQAMDWIGNARLGVAAGCVGSAQFLIEKAVDYAEERETFGGEPFDRPAGNFVSALAEVAADIERTRQLYRYAAWKADTGRDARKETAMAKLSAANLENDAADVSMQVHGGKGYSRREPIEERYRSSRETTYRRHHRRNAKANHRPRASGLIAFCPCNCHERPIEIGTRRTVMGCTYSIEHLMQTSETSSVISATASLWLSR